MKTITAAESYWKACDELLANARNQQSNIEQAADWFSATILAQRMVHLFGSGHSRIMVEEMWPRYGSFPGFNPIVELSLTFHNPVVGANGQRQAMYLENCSGLAQQILRNFDIRAEDSALIISSGGCSVVAIEMAQLLLEKNVKVVGMVSLRHCLAATSQHPQNIKLPDVVDLILDTGAPIGDAMVRVSNLETPVSPGSTVGGCLLINALKAEIADRLTKAGQPPKVLTAANIIGAERSQQLFQSAYDEHAHRLARLFAEVGKE